MLATDGVEQVELTEPAKALRDAGARVDVISPKAGKIQGMNHDERGDSIAVDVVLKDAQANDYDALVLPGGVANPDKLRIEREAVKFVEAFVAADKPIAAICHGPWTLINAGGVKGKRMTSWPSLQADLINAGARWTDEPVVKDRTSRHVPQTRRHSAIQPSHDRDVCGGLRRERRVAHRIRIRGAHAAIEAAPSVGPTAPDLDDRRGAFPQMSQTRVMPPLTGSIDGPSWDSHLGRSAAWAVWSPDCRYSK